MEDLLDPGTLLKAISSHKSRSAIEMEVVPGDLIVVCNSTPLERQTARPGYLKVDSFPINTI